MSSHVTPVTCNDVHKTPMYCVLCTVLMGRRMCRVKLDRVGGKSEASFHLQMWGEITFYIDPESSILA